VFVVVSPLSYISGRQPLSRDVREVKDTAHDGDNVPNGHERVFSGKSDVWPCNAGTQSVGPGRSDPLPCPCPAMRLNTVGTTYSQIVSSNRKHRLSAINCSARKYMNNEIINIIVLINYYYLYL